MNSVSEYLLTYTNYVGRKQGFFAEVIDLSHVLSGVTLVTHFCGVTLFLVLQRPAAQSGMIVLIQAVWLQRCNHAELIMDNPGNRHAEACTTNVSSPVAALVPRHTAPAV